MAIRMTQLREYTCDLESCGHVWRPGQGGPPKLEYPRACPRCLSPHWNDGGAGVNGREGKGKGKG